MTAEGRTCASCGYVLADDEFYIDPRRGQPRTWCKRCHALRQKHRISARDWDRMYDQQRARCAVCDEEHSKMVVDHDHETGNTRALLCHACNLVLGHSGDDPELLERAARYLREHSGR